MNVYVLEGDNPSFAVLGIYSSFDVAKQKAAEWANIAYKGESLKSEISEEACFYWRENAVIGSHSVIKVYPFEVDTDGEWFNMLRDRQ